VKIRAEEIKERLRKRPVTAETPQRKNYKLLQEEIDMVDELTARYGKAKINDTEVIRAAIRAFNNIPKEDGFEVIYSLPKVRRGRRKG
jgi:hypothetical protein